MQSPRVEWFKSSYSQENGLCLEARRTRSGVDLRDSKNATGSHISLPAAAWTAFLVGIGEPSQPPASR
jgi:hypothetical protein